MQPSDRLCRLVLVDDILISAPPLPSPNELQVRQKKKERSYFPHGYILEYNLLYGQAIPPRLVGLQLIYVYIFLDG